MSFCFSFYSAWRSCLYGTWEVLLLYFFPRFSRCLEILYNTSCWTALYLENLDASKISADPSWRKPLVHQGGVWWTCSEFWSQLHCVHHGASWSVRFTAQWALEPWNTLKYSTEIQQTEIQRYLSDTCACTIQIHRTGSQACDHPASFHQFIHFSISFLLCFSLAVILCDINTCATQVSIPIPFLTHTAFLLTTPALPLSSMRICSPAHTDSQILLMFLMYTLTYVWTSFLSALLRDKLIANNLIGTIKHYLKCLWRCYYMPCTGTLTCGKQSQIHKVYT